MAKRRVLQWGFQRQKFVQIEDKATIGATLGVDLFNADGTLVTIEQLAAALTVINKPGSGSVIWRFILELPRNILNLAALFNDPSKWIPTKDAISSTEVVTINQDYQLIIEEYFEIEVGGVLNIDGSFAIL